MEYQNVEFNTGIDDKEFEFIPPESAKIVEQKFEPPEKLTIEEAQGQVNFTIAIPEYTASYEFSHAMVFKFDGKETVILYYTKDGDAITISESTAGEGRPIPNTTKVKIEDKEGEIAEIFGNKILRLYSDGIEIAISGKISEEELIRIAESMI
jgi:hypothetical protein